MTEPRFWLGWRGEWREVTKAEYVAAERHAGFHNTTGRPDEPATAAWGGNSGISGTTFDPHADEED